MKVEGLKQLSLEEAEGLAGVWWEGLPQALRVTPHPASLSSPTHPLSGRALAREIQQKWGNREGAELGPSPGQRGVIAHPSWVSGYCWGGGGCPGGRNGHLIKILSLLSPHFSASSFLLRHRVKDTSWS